jgi:hypothetical protein
MMNPMHRLGPGKRLALSIALMGLVHVGLLFFGNEDATPLRLLGSFALAATLLVVAQRMRQHLNASAAPLPSSPVAGDRNVP